MFGLSTTELLIVLVVLLLLFGSRLPTVMRSLGKSVTEFKKGMNEIDEDVKPQDKKDNSAHTPAG
jgi:sec-independent protein translocase protein TatA